MNIEVQELVEEIGRLHIQVMVQQKAIAELTAKVDAHTASTEQK